MERKVMIDDKEVRLVSSGATPITHLKVIFSKILLE